MNKFDLIDDVERSITKTELALTFVADQNIETYLDTQHFLEL
jgi:hypothetical protein